MKNTKSAFPHLTSAIIALFLIAWPLPAQKIELSPQVQVSGPNPFADCTADQAYPFYSKVETEPVVLVNPLNPRHIVTLWMQDQWVNIPPARGLVSAASFDGGIRWSTSALPGRSLCFGGQFHWGADPWLTFSPGGGLYAIGLAGDLSRSNRPHRNAVLVNKSVDGSYWSNAIKLIDENTDHFNDQPAVAADPQNSNLAYAVWVRTGFNFGVPTTVMFTRTTDAGQSWEGARPIFTALSSDGAAKPQLVVQPGGTLIVLFKEMQYSGNRLVHEFLTAVRSTDKGLTWSGPTRGPELQTQGVVDPKTGLPVSLSGFPLVAQASDGNLYAVWQDGRFGAVGIAFAMSSDGAYTWSTPIRVITRRRTRLTLSRPRLPSRRTGLSQSLISISAFITRRLLALRRTTGSSPPVRQAREA